MTLKSAEKLQKKNSDLLNYDETSERSFVRLAKWLETRTQATRAGWGQGGGGDPGLCWKLPVGLSSPAELVFASKELQQQDHTTKSPLPNKADTNVPTDWQT